MDSDEKQNKGSGSSCAVNDYTNNLGGKLLKQIKYKSSNKTYFLNF